MVKASIFKFISEKFQVCRSAGFEVHMVHIREKIEFSTGHLSDHRLFRFFVHLKKAQDAARLSPAAHPGPRTYLRIAGAGGDKILAIFSRSCDLSAFFLTRDAL